MTVNMVVSFFGAFVLGFAAHRASLCTVKAVAEAITVRRFYMLVSFVKTTIWIVALSVLAMAVFGVSTPVAHWPLTFWSIGGGLLFGVGAAVNGGCAFSTLARLGDGDINLSATVLGWLAGAWMERTLFPLHIQAPQRHDLHGLIGGPLTALAITAACGWFLWQAIVIMRPFPMRTPLSRAIMAPNYKLSVSAALIAAANLLLYENLGSWSFTSIILSTTAPLKFPAVTSLPLHWLVLAFVLAGMAISSKLRNSFSYTKLRASRLAAHGAAGLVMGFGAAMIPGGNDSLILYGIGFLSPHAIPAFVSILAGVALTFAVVKMFGGAPPAVYCSGDICMSPSTERASGNAAAAVNAVTASRDRIGTPEQAGAACRRNSKRRSNPPPLASGAHGVFCKHKSIRTRLRAWSLLRRLRVTGK